MGDCRLLAFDLGAESGRAMFGELRDGALSLREVHRFPNEPVLVPDGLHWDSLRLWHEIQAGLAKAAAEHGPEYDGIAVDAWGVDFALLGKGGAVLGEPFHYRDHRTDGILPAAYRLVPREEIYAATGIQFMPINTLYQLWVMRTQGSPLLDQAESLLFIPGLLSFYLTGLGANEFSIATTSQCYSVPKGDWAWDLLRRFSLPAQLFPPVVATGTALGPLRQAVTDRTGARGTVIAGAGHDTAAAVAAVPAEGADFMYISCGTWSLAGAELPAPLVNGDSLAGGFTNEGGVCGTIRFLKNIMGLWLVQECRRAWARSGREYDYAELAALAAAAPPFRTIVDPDDPSFLNPPDMPAAITAYAARTGQRAPATPGEFVRSALEGLALAYRRTLSALERLLARRLPVIHMVGGGTRNELLCQFTADATGRPLVAGPAEATAAGNILVQAVALRYLGGLAEARAVVRRSFDLRIYEPQAGGAWDDAYERFQSLAKG